jgi:hypothetical protein
VVPRKTDDLPFSLLALAPPPLDLDSHPLALLASASHATSLLFSPPLPSRDGSFCSPASHLSSDGDRLQPRSPQCRRLSRRVYLQSRQRATTAASDVADGGRWKRAAERCAVGSRCVGEGVAYLQVLRKLGDPKDACECDGLRLFVLVRGEPLM